MRRDDGFDDDGDAADGPEDVTPWGDAAIPGDAPTRPGFVPVDVAALPDLPGTEDATVEDYQRPTTRADCLAGGMNAARPCPWLSCPEHTAHGLGPDHPVGKTFLSPDLIQGRNGAARGVALDGPAEDAALGWLGSTPFSCVLDAADAGCTLEDVGEVFGFSRERSRQIENTAMVTLKRRGGVIGPAEATAMGIRPRLKTMAPVPLPDVLETRAILRDLRVDLDDAPPSPGAQTRGKTAARFADDAAFRHSDVPADWAHLGHPEAIREARDRAWCPTLRAPVTGALCATRNRLRDETAGLSPLSRRPRHKTCAECPWGTAIAERLDAAEAPPKRRLPIFTAPVGIAIAGVMPTAARPSARPRVSLAPVPPVPAPVTPTPPPPQPPEGRPTMAVTPPSFPSPASPPAVLSLCAVKDCGNRLPWRRVAARPPSPLDVLCGHCRTVLKATVDRHNLDHGLAVGYYLQHASLKGIIGWAREAGHIRAKVAPAPYTIRVTDKPGQPVVMTVTAKPSAPTAATPPAPEAVEVLPPVPVASTAATSATASPVEPVVSPDALLSGSVGPITYTLRVTLPDDARRLFALGEAHGFTRCAKIIEAVLAMTDDASGSGPAR